MLSYQIREYYEFLINEFKKFQESIEVLFEYEKQYRDHYSKTTTIILSASTLSTSGTHNYQTKDNGLITGFNAINVNLSANFDFFKAFGDFTTLKTNISNYKQNSNIEISVENEMITLIEGTFAAFQAYLQTQNDKGKAVVFADKLMLFISKYTEFLSFLKKTISLFESTTESSLPIQGTKTIDIQLLDVEFDLEEFSACLGSIQAIYSQFEQVSIQERITKLRVVKIESGSLLAKLLGDENIIETIASLLKKTIDLCFNKFTFEGKILRHSELREQLVLDIDLMNKMQASGLDTSQGKENIEIAYTIITKETLAIASKTSKFKINGEVLKASEHISEKYLEENKMKYLTATNEDETIVKTDNLKEDE